MAHATERYREALEGVSSVLRDITQELQNTQNQVQYWKIEADAWKARYEQERTRSERLRRVLRCAPSKEGLTAHPSLAVSPRARSVTGYAPILQPSGGSLSARYSYDDRSSLQDSQTQFDAAQSSRQRNQHSCSGHMAQPEAVTSEPLPSSFVLAQQQEPQQQGEVRAAEIDSSAKRPVSKSHDGALLDADAAAEGEASGVDAAMASVSSIMFDPFASGNKDTAPTESTPVQQQARGDELYRAGSFSFSPAISAPAVTIAAAAMTAESSDSAALDQQSPRHPDSTVRVLQSVHVLDKEGALAQPGQQEQQQLQSQQPPPPFRRASTLPRSFGYGDGSISRSGALPAGWSSSFTAGVSPSFSGMLQRPQHKHTVDQLLRMMMAFTIMQGSNTAGQAEADGISGTEGTEEEPLPTVSLDDDDGSSGVGLAAAAAVSAAMARAWASAASREQRAVAAAGGAAFGSGETSGAPAQRAGFRLIATVTNKMGKRAPSSAALNSSYSQDSMDASSSMDLPGITKTGSGCSNSKEPTTTTTQAAAGSMLSRSGSGTCAEAPEQQQTPAQQQSSSSSSSGKPPLAPAPTGGEGSNGSVRAASSATAAAQSSAASAGAAPNTGQAAAISLHWLSRPRTVLVMRKLAPSTEAAFLKSLEWLRRHHITIYVEPKVFEELLDSGRVQPAPHLQGSNGTNSIAGQLVNTATSPETTAGGGALQSYLSWPTHSKPAAGASSSSTAITTTTAAAPAGPFAGAAQCFGLVKTWQPEVHVDQQGDDATKSVSDLIPEAVAQQLDLVVVLGGDGTVLWTCHIFGNRSVPPLVPFNLGSLGFLTPFDPAQVEKVLHKALKGGFPITLRHRLHCTIVRCANPCGPCSSHQSALPAVSRSCLGSSVYGEEHVALNEVVIERGISPFLTNLETFCDGAFVTHVQGDGLIIGTPTGSTAYSLAAGGSMVHPQVPCILFTPICPHSLSFRPLMFPDYCQLCIQVPVNSRGHVWASFDGKDRTELAPGDAVVVRLSRWPVPSVAAEADPSGDWFSAVRECLHWNVRKVQGGAGA